MVDVALRRAAPIAELVRRDLYKRVDVAAVRGIVLSFDGSM